MTTRGIEQLKAAGVHYRRLDYAPRETGVRYAASVLGLAPRTVLKSLVFVTEGGEFLFALMAGDGNVSTRKLARATCSKRVAPASPHDAERVTGYRIGGISPLGAKRPLPVVLDARAAALPRLAINAGNRGTLVQLRGVDLIEQLRPLIADIRVE